MSRASSPASSSARRAASNPRSAEDTPLLAKRRSSMPVRWRIHSSFVSISRERRSLVTTPSGTNIPEPRIVVLGGFTCKIIAIRRRLSAVRGTPPGSGVCRRAEADSRRFPQLGELEVPRARVDLGGLREDGHTRARGDGDPAGGRAARSELIHHGIDSDGLSGAHINVKASDLVARRVVAHDLDGPGVAPVVEEEVRASSIRLRKPEAAGRCPVLNSLAAVEGGAEGPVVPLRPPRRAPRGAADGHARRDQGG